MAIYAAARAPGARGRACRCRAAEAGRRPGPGVWWAAKRLVLYGVHGAASRLLVVHQWGVEPDLLGSLSLFPCPQPKGGKGVLTSKYWLWLFNVTMCFGPGTMIIHSSVVMARGQCTPGVT